MVATVLLVLGAVGLNQLLQRDQSYPPETVDFTTTLAAARADAPFAVVVPEPVPPGWRATSVDAGRENGEYVWHLGFVVDESQYVGIDQSTGDPDVFLEQVTPATAKSGSVEVDGVRWQTLTEPGGDEEALVLRRPDHTTVVSGTLSREVLVSVAQLLQRR